MSQQLELLRRMLLIRQFEETIVSLAGKGEIVGALHTATGQEAEIVGACMALRPGDYMIGNHRSHGHPIAKGAAIRPLMAELFGKRTGVNKGKGGSMHLADFSVGSLGETSIVGSGLPVAVGAALGSKMKRDHRVTLCFFGDGASNEGTFHESLNMAAIWNLPVVFLCENNGYAVSVPASYAIAGNNIAGRAAAYGIPGHVVDGQDVEAALAIVSDAVELARNGGGPTLIEAKTYRYMEHAASITHVSYRSNEEIEEWKLRDPIVLFKARLLAQGYDKDLFASVKHQVDEVISDAVRFARESEFPDAGDAYQDVFATECGVVA
jgi:acetoin:2,6-dichlorophenolindophenol oxidoreductase subunit alpha